MTSGSEITNRPPAASGGEKRIHEMDRLGDIGRLPASVFWVTGINNAFTVFITSLVHRRHWEIYFMLLWLAGVLAANLLPVVVLRLTVLQWASEYPTLSEMKLRRDFYKLSDWVYLAPAVNLGAWVVFSWVVLTYRNIPAMILLLSAGAFLCASSPVCARLLFSLLGHRRVSDE